MKKLSKINENIFDGIGRRSKGGVVRKEDEVKSVDLGLPSGTIWATCNLGASSPEEYGNYYAWGETEPKDNYSWKTYKFGKKNNLTKYNEKDGKIILDPEDDAAHVVLGGKWHMPTEEQIIELLDKNNTTNEIIELNGVDGILIKSRINDNTLFFPFSGYKDVDDEDAESIGFSFSYLSSSLNKSLHSCAMQIYSNSYAPIMLDYIPRYGGSSVRGVFEKKKK